MAGSVPGMLGPGPQGMMGPIDAVFACVRPCMREGGGGLPNAVVKVACVFHFWKKFQKINNTLRNCCCFCM